MYMESMKEQIRTGAILALSAFVSALALVTSTQAAAKTPWLSYKSNLLNVQVSVPSDWKPVKIPKALAFHADDLSGGTAAIGILKSDQTGSIEEAADKQFEREGRPPDWVRSPARVDGMRAIKIVGMVGNSSNRKMVHYFIETPQGNYLVQCQATADRWSTFGPIFSTILSKLKFL
jgi:hypothetical protein